MVYVISAFWNVEGKRNPNHLCEETEVLGQDGGSPEFSLDGEDWRANLLSGVVLMLSGKFAGALASVLVAVPISVALAHHSYAMFDRDKVVKSDAIVRTWEFTNPHATLWVYINDAQGKPILWGLEAPGPTQLLRSGWDKDTVKPGDKVTVSVNPLRDGRNGGSLVNIVLADGRSMNTGGPPGGDASAPDGDAKAQ